MTHSMTLRLPEELNARLERLAESNNQTKSNYVRALIEEDLAELESVAKLDAYAEAVRRGEVETRPMSESIREFGLDPDELLAEVKQEMGL